MSEPEPGPKRTPERDPEKPKHLTELQLAEALLAGQTPVCPVPGCTRCAPEIAAMQRTAAQFRDEVLPRTLPRLQEQAATAKASPATAAATAWWASLVRPWVMGPMVGAAAVALLWVVVSRRGELEKVDPDQPDHYVGEKGERDAVRVYARAAAGAGAGTGAGAGAVRLLGDGGTVHPGEALRFAVDPKRGRFALVVSIDGGQQISVYAPFDGNRSAEVVAAPDAPDALKMPDAPDAGFIELPGSVELDGQLGDERLWILLSDQPLEVFSFRPLLERLAAGGPAAVKTAGADALTDARPGVHATTLLLHKAP